jgi:hypothetical protein
MIQQILVLNDINSEKLSGSFVFFLSYYSRENSYGEP